MNAFSCGAVLCRTSQTKFAPHHPMAASPALACSHDSTPLQPRPFSIRQIQLQCLEFLAGSKIPWKMAVRVWKYELAAFKVISSIKPHAASEILVISFHGHGKKNRPGLAKDPGHRHPACRSLPGSKHVMKVPENRVGLHWRKREQQHLGKSKLQPESRRIAEIRPVLGPQMCCYEAVFADLRDEIAVK